jgi:hypothetical protein
MVLGGSTALAAALALAGCGGGSAGASTSAWEGNWMEGGTQSTTCGPTVLPASQISQLLVISAGTKSGTIETDADSCSLIWDVSGDKATLESGQSCTASVDGVDATVGWTASSMTLSGTTITGTAGGAATNSCSFNQQFTLTKM